LIIDKLFLKNIHCDKSFILTNICCYF